MNHVIVTHVSPDFDAIGSVWLLKRYGGMEDADVRFVNTGAPDPLLLASADAVVDTGRVYDPERHRFDHHHFPGQEANATCAAMQVYAWLWEYYDARMPDWYKAIEPLVQLILSGDTGRVSYGADWSRRVGIHALLSNKKRQGADDYALLAYGFEILDSLAASLIAQDEARRTLAQHTVYRSDDGLVIALKDAPQGATFAAHEAGARLVCFASELPGPSYARGILRGGEGADVHAGALVERVINSPALSWNEPDLRAELAGWYRHEAGFFAGKGTAKAPCSDSMQCSIVDVAAAIDAAWTR